MSRAACLTALVVLLATAGRAASFDNLLLPEEPAAGPPLDNLLLAEEPLPPEPKIEIRRVPAQPATPPATNAIPPLSNYYYYRPAYQPAYNYQPRRFRRNW
jgi:hypothetical protein